MWIRIAGGCGALAVLAGAFGAHGLRGHISADLLAAYRTGALYHLLHSAVLLALALYGRSAGVRITRPAVLVVLGLALFSGSLYAMALSGLKTLGMITPFGGICLILAWLDVAVFLAGSNAQSR